MGVKCLAQGHNIGPRVPPFCGRIFLGGGGGYQCPFLCMVLSSIFHIIIMASLRMRNLKFEEMEKRKKHR